MGGWENNKKNLRSINKKGQKYVNENKQKPLLSIVAKLFEINSKSIYVK